MEGYRKALARHGLAAPANFVIGGSYEDAGGYRAMRRLLALKHRPDGVFCFNDPVAAGAVKAILEASLERGCQTYVTGNAATNCRLDFVQEQVRAFRERADAARQFDAATP